VIGQEFVVELLSLTARLSDDDVLDVLAAAESVALVREAQGTPGRYVFAHALIQSTLYHSLGPTHRARAHRRVGEALEVISRDRPGSRVAELAHHWFEATQQVDAAKAIAYCVEAAEASRAALAPDAAVRYYQQARQLYDELDARDEALGLDLAIGLGVAQRQAGIAEFRETLLDASMKARELDDEPRLVAAALANNRGYFSTMSGIDHEKVAALEAALEAMPHAPSVERSLLLATLCNELGFTSSFDRRRALAEEATVIAEGTGDPATILQVTNQLELPLDIPHTLDQRLQQTAYACELARQVDDPVLSFWAANWRSIVAGQAGLIDEEDRCLEMMTDISRRVGQPMLIWNARYHAARRAMLSGDPDEVERYATEALEIGTDSGQPDAFAFYGAQLITVGVQRGSVGDLVPLIEDAARQNPDVSGFKAALALALTFGPEPEAALPWLDAVVPGAPALPLDMAWLTSMTLYAEAAVRLEAHEPARGIIDQLSPWHAQISDNGLTVQGPVAYYLGGLCMVLGRVEDAETFFKAAVDLSRRAGAEFHLASAQLGYARLLLQRNSSDARGRQMLSDAADSAKRRGYAELTRMAAALSG
jgi:tetratricopeptide (TPR) repeat protein